MVDDLYGKRENRLDPGGLYFSETYHVLIYKTPQLLDDAQYKYGPDAIAGVYAHQLFSVVSHLALQKVRMLKIHEPFMVLEPTKLAESRTNAYAKILTGDEQVGYLPVTTWTCYLPFDGKNAENHSQYP